MMKKDGATNLCDCERCGYKWFSKPTVEKVTPTVCANPKCKSPYWNTARKTVKEAVKK